MSMAKNDRLRLLLISLLFCLCAAPGMAGNCLSFAADKIVSAGITMTYRVAYANNPGKQSIVIYLHGGSSKGNDNEAQMQEPGIDSIATYLDRKQMNVVFLVPQCPADKSWGGPMLSVLKALIYRYVGTNADDADVYIFGGSMGGTGTWSMLSAYPHLFAAAMPVAGNPSKCNPANVASTPVYTVMGTADRIMSVETTSRFIAELNALGATTQFDVEEGWTHEVTCIQSYTSKRLDWVFSHRTDDSGVANPPVTEKIIQTIQYFTVDGKLLPERPCKGLYLERITYTDASVLLTKRLK